MYTVVWTPDPSARLVPVDGVGIAARRVWGGGDLVPCGTIQLMSGGCPVLLQESVQHWLHAREQLRLEHEIEDCRHALRLPGTGHAPHALPAAS